MTTYEETIKSSDEIALHDIVEVGGVLQEVLRKCEISYGILLYTHCITVLSEQDASSESLKAEITLPRGIMVKTLK